LLLPTLFACLLVLSSPGLSAAQNLLANPDFDTDTSGWTANVSWIQEFHDTEDLTEPSPSGSVRVVNTRETGGGNGLYQCVLAYGDALYDFSIWTRIPTGQSMTGEASLRLFWFGNETCDFADDLGVDIFRITTPSESWAQISQLDFAVPTGVRSVRFDLGVHKDAPGGSFEAKFDAVYMPEPGLGHATAAGFVFLLGLHGGRSTRRSAR
jgi:hypothetical protein